MTDTHLQNTLLWLREKLRRSESVFSSAVSAKQVNSSERYIVWCRDWLLTLEAEAAYRNAHGLTTRHKRWEFTTANDAINAMELIRGIASRNHLCNNFGFIDSIDEHDDCMFDGDYKKLCTGLTKENIRLQDKMRKMDKKIDDLELRLTIARKHYREHLATNRQLTAENAKNHLDAVKYKNSFRRAAVLWDGIDNYIGPFSGLGSPHLRKNRKALNKLFDECR